MDHPSPKIKPHVTFPPLFQDDLARESRQLHERQRKILSIRVIRVIRGKYFIKLKGKDMTEILFREESYRIIGACYEVYNEKGCGF